MNTANFVATKLKIRIQILFESLPKRSGVQNYLKRWKEGSGWFRWRARQNISRYIKRYLEENLEQMLSLWLSQKNQQLAEFPEMTISMETRR